MSDANSRSIVSNQAGIHEKLDEIEMLPLLQM